MKKWSVRSQGGPIAIYYKLATFSPTGEWTLSSKSRSMVSYKEKVMFLFYLIIKVKNETFNVYAFTLEDVDVLVDLPVTISYKAQYLSGVVKATNSRTGVPVFGNLTLVAEIRNQENHLEMLSLSQPAWDALNRRNSYIYSKEEALKLSTLEELSIHLPSSRKTSSEFYSHENHLSLQFVSYKDKHQAPQKIV